MSADPRERFDGLDDEEFADLVSSTWRRQGWSIRARDTDELESALPDGLDGALTVVGRSSDQQLVLTLPPAEGTMGAPELIELVSALPEPENLTVVAAAGFTTGSLSVADAYGVDVVGPEALARLTERRTDEEQFWD